MMKTKHKLVMLTLIGMVVARASPAGVIESLNNTTDGIVIDNSRADWASLTAYTADSAGESGIGPFDVDWDRVTIANNFDQDTLYVRYEMNNGADFNSFPAFYNIFIDTDEDRGTGYIGGGSQLSIGAEYLIQGSTVYSFSGGGDQTAFSWTFVASLAADNSFANLDISYSLSASTIGSPPVFRFVLLGDNGLNGNTPDFYPDGGDQGVNGDYFEYTMSLFVPDVTFADMVVTNATAFLVTNSLADVNYRLEFAPTDAPTNWAFSGFHVNGNGGNLYLYDPVGFATTKIYRVLAEH